MRIFERYNAFHYRICLAIKHLTVASVPSLTATYNETHLIEQVRWRSESLSSDRILRYLLSQEIYFPVTTHSRTLSTVCWEQYTKSHQICIHSLQYQLQYSNKFIQAYFNSTNVHHQIYFLHFIFLKCFLKITIHCDP
jgi:hypothetical protein